MKVLVSSDLHLDFNQLTLNWNLKEEYDAIVLLGDYGNQVQFVIDKLKKIQKESGKEIIFILGNHDYWDDVRNRQKKHLMQQTQGEFQENFPNFLNRKVLEFGGERFLGCTLWYQLEGKQQFADYHYILDHWMIEEEAKQDLQFLKDNLRPGDIVMTHLQPSFEVVDAQYRFDPYNKFFVRDVLDLIKERRPKLWLSGHAHSRRIQRLHETLYIRNPRGYPGENPFYSHLIIDTLKTKEYDCIVDCGTNSFRF